MNKFDVDGDEKLDGLWTFFTILKAFVAASIIYLPKVFQDGGLVFSIFAFTGSAILYMYCSHLLIDSRIKTNAKSYQHLGEITLGSYASYLISFNLVFSLMGFVVGCTYIIVKNMSELFGVHRYLVFVFCFIVQSILSYIRKI